MKQTFTLLGLVIALTACNEGTVSVTTEKDSTGTDSLYRDSIANLDTFQRNTLAPEGIYQVILPCTDCKGLEHTVSFSPDMTYSMEEEKLGKKESIIRTTGSWKPYDGKIWLYEGEKVKAKYDWKGDTLYYLPASGSPMFMQKMAAAGENPVWRKKRADGIEFFGVGNEPFWNVEVDEQKNIAFQLADWTTPLSFKPSKPVVSADSTVYTTQSDSGQLRITIFNSFCSDGMSDNVYNNRVAVVYKGTVYNGCGILFK